MPRCNSKRCGFLGITCIGDTSDAYCALRLTPKEINKKMKELEIIDIKQLWKVIKKYLK